MKKFVSGISSAIGVGGGASEAEPSDSRSGSYLSYKWIATEIVDGRRNLQVNERDVNPMLASLGQGPINLVSIFGRARQGKSFLM
jgi:hypothetical protein